MAKPGKPPVKRRSAPAKFPKVRAGELLTLLDFVRFAVSRFVEAELVFAHGTTDPLADILAPVLVKQLRTSEIVRVALSVRQSTMTSEPPGPNPSYRAGV